jgi:rhamnogalacturonan endolyase
MTATLGMSAQVTPQSQMERLDRGVVAIPTSVLSGKTFLSWRLLGTDDKAATTFDVVRDGEVIASGLTNTNYEDNGGSATAKYEIVTKVNGQQTETSKPVTPWAKKFLTLTLDQPATGTEGGTYTPNDMSVGDIDGDGQYELFVKWNPSTAHDNSEDGKTDKVFIDCYRLDGTKLWRIDLGKNIRAGAHYTQFMVYDFDGDGKAEMICKTAPGSIDGKGQYVNKAATDETILKHGNLADYRVTSGSHQGHVLSGPEYLTVFSGETGEALHTTWYLPGRAGTGSSVSEERGDELGKVSTFPSSGSFWGDSYGGRSERYLAAVAYLNGADAKPSAVFSRGYYTRAYVWAVNFDGKRLHTEWLHVSHNPTQWLVYATKYEEGQAGLTYTIDGDVLKRIPVKTAPANTGGVKSTDSSGGIAGSNTLYGNGNHNLSIADVDGDGCDEILWGAAALDNDGSLLYATGYGHGDAIHVGKMRPDDDDLYVFDVHEEKLTAAHGSWDLHNARTGEVVYHGDKAESDNGRGMAAALMDDSKGRGYQFWSSDNRQPRAATTGKEAISKSCTVNFRIYWDGSMVDQLFDGNAPSGSTEAKPYIQKWNGSSFTTVLEFNSATYNYGQTCNTTKATPCLQADILGDWREEVILWNKNNPAEINIYSTWTPTTYTVPTLMHDHVYRMGIAWQNTAYNQPPHLGYYLPDYINGKLVNSIPQVPSAMGKEKVRIFDLQGRLLPYSSTDELPRGLYLVGASDKGSSAKKVLVK